MTISNKKYDLKERTLKFSQDIFNYVRSLEDNEISRVLIKQLVRSGTSVGANYLEADESMSKRDFIHKIYICNKDAKETNYWLKLLATCKGKNDENERFAKEAREFNLIFSKIIQNKRDNY